MKKFLILLLLRHEFLLLRQLVCKQLHTGLGCGKFGLGVRKFVLYLAVLAGKILVFELAVLQTLLAGTS